MDDSVREAQYAAWCAFEERARVQSAEVWYGEFKTLLAADNRYARKLEPEFAAARKNGMHGSSSFWNTPYRMSDVAVSGGPDAKSYGGLYKPTE
jgi:hypothetical protein